MTSASAVSIFRPPFQISRSKPMALNIPHLVGMRVDAIRQSAPDCAVASTMYSCAGIGFELIAGVTDLFGCDWCRRLVEIRRTLLEECRKRFFRFCRAQPFKELRRLDF